MMTRKEFLDSLGVEINHLTLEEILEKYDLAKERIQQCEEKIGITFQQFWDLYDKKIDSKKCEKKWNKLMSTDKLAIMQYIPKYKQAEPNKKYRRNPETFLNNRSWENEIILPVNVEGPSKTEQTIEVITKLRQENAAN